MSKGGGGRGKIFQCVFGKFRAILGKGQVQKKRGNMVRAGKDFEGGERHELRDCVKIKKGESREKRYWVRTFWLKGNCCVWGGRGVYSAGRGGNQDRPPQKGGVCGGLGNRHTDKILWGGGKGYIYSLGEKKKAFHSVRKRRGKTLSSLWRVGGGW